MRASGCKPLLSMSNAFNNRTEAPGPIKIQICDKILALNRCEKICNGIKMSGVKKVNHQTVQRQLFSLRISCLYPWETEFLPSSSLRDVRHSTGKNSTRPV